MNIFEILTKSTIAVWQSPCVKILGVRAEHSRQMLPQSDTVLKYKKNVVVAHPAVLTQVQFPESEI